MKLSAEHTEAAFLLPMPRGTDRTNDSDEAGHLTSSTKPPLLFTLQFHPPAMANRSLLHFHQQILLVNEGRKSSTRLYKKTASDQMACYNTGPTSFSFSAMYAFISLQGPQNNCG